MEVSGSLSLVAFQTAVRQPPLPVNNVKALSAGHGAWTYTHFDIPTTSFNQRGRNFLDFLTGPR
jgi:hypothetical protein